MSGKKKLGTTHTELKVRGVLTSKTNKLANRITGEIPERSQEHRRTVEIQRDRNKGESRERKLKKKLKPETATRKAREKHSELQTGFRQECVYAWGL